MPTVAPMRMQRAMYMHTHVAHAGADLRTHMHMGSGGAIDGEPDDGGYVPVTRHTAHGRIGGLVMTVRRGNVGTQCGDACASVDSGEGVPPCGACHTDTTVHPELDEYDDDEYDLGGASLATFGLIGASRLPVDIAPTEHAASHAAMCDVHAAADEGEADGGARASHAAARAAQSR